VNIARDCPHCVLLLGVTLQDDDMAVSGSKRHTRSHPVSPRTLDNLANVPQLNSAERIQLFQLALRQPVIEGSQREQARRPSGCSIIGQHTRLYQGAPLRHIGLEPRCSRFLLRFRESSAGRTKSSLAILHASGAAFTHRSGLARAHRTYWRGGLKDTLNAMLADKAILSLAERARTGL
jgi:hypothetical protein